MTSPESMTFTQLATTDPKWKPVSGGAFNQRQAHSGWNKVTIVSGGQYEKEYVLSSVLRALEPSQFIPFAYGVHGTDSYFHIYCVSAVGAIIDRGYKITTLEGIAWIVKLEPCGPPRYTYYFLKDVLSKVVQLRFNQEKKLLDLSHFAMDEAFTDIAYPSLTIQKVVQDVFYKFLTLVALDLSDNKLHTLDHFGSFTKKIVSVKYLNLKNNLLKDMNSLDILQGLTLLQELILDGNPLCSKYSDGNAYIKEVRQRFPRIKSLDGISLPPVEANGIPPSKSHFLLSNKGKKIVEQFLEGYYNRYDSDDRKNLLDTYHDEAMFSLTSTYLAGQDLASSSVKLTPYMLESRNILRTSDYSKCHKLLRQGKSEIVSFLATLPKTEHDASSFSVDLIHFTPKVMVLSTCGVFRERDSNDEKKDGPLRSFSRLFAVVPFRKKFCIVNEELHVTNASKQQIQMSFPPTDMKDEESLESIDSEDKMVAVLSEITTMKPEWAKKCLVETNWNLKDALVTFRDLYKQSSVPVEAFK